MRVVFADRAGHLSHTHDNILDELFSTVETAVGVYTEEGRYTALLFHDLIYAKENGNAAIVPAFFPPLAYPFESIYDNNISPYVSINRFIYENKNFHIPIPDNLQDHAEICSNHRKRADFIKFLDGEVIPRLGEIFSSCSAEAGTNIAEQIQFPILLWNIAERCCDPTLVQKCYYSSKHIFPIKHGMVMHIIPKGTRIISILDGDCIADMKLDNTCFICIRNKDVLDGDYGNIRPRVYLPAYRPGSVFLYTFPDTIEEVIKAPECFLIDSPYSEFPYSVIGFFNTYEFCRICFGPYSGLLTPFNVFRVFIGTRFNFSTTIVNTSCFQEIPAGITSAIKHFHSGIPYKRAYGMVGKVRR